MIGRRIKSAGRIQNGTQKCSSTGSSMEIGFLWLRIAMSSDEFQVISFNQIFALLRHHIFRNCEFLTLNFDSAPASIYNFFPWVYCVAQNQKRRSSGLFLTLQISERVASISLDTAIQISTDGYFTVKMCHHCWNVEKDL
jgi:hypothetical protein